MVRGGESNSNVGGGIEGRPWSRRPRELAPQIVQLRLAGLELGAESSFTLFQVKAPGLLRGGARGGRGESPGEGGGFGLQEQFCSALLTGFLSGEFSVCDGSTETLVVPLGFRGARFSFKLSGAPSSSFSLVSGGAVLHEAVNACRFLGGVSSFPSLVVAAAPSLLRFASTGHRNRCGVFGTLVHKGIATARSVDGGEVGRASGSEEERLQYRGQGAVRGRNPPSSRGASEMVEGRTKSEMVERLRIIESVFAVPKCNSKTVIPRIKAQTARREMHRTRRPELEDPRTQQVAPKCNSKTKTPKESEHRLRAEGTTADGEIMMPKIRATNGLQIPRGKSIQES